MVRDYGTVSLEAVAREERPHHRSLKNSSSIVFGLSVGLLVSCIACAFVMVSQDSSISTQTVELDEVEANQALPKDVLDILDLAKLDEKHEWQV